jgi:hypothetical protein
MLSIKCFGQQKSTATAVLEWLPPVGLEPTASWIVSRFHLRFPSFSARILAKSRPLRQTLFASSATGGASQPLPPTSMLSIKRFRQQKSTA